MFYFDNHIYCTYMYTYYLATSSVRRYFRTTYFYVLSKVLPYSIYVYFRK